MQQWFIDLSDQLNMFRAIFRPSSGAWDWDIYSIWFVLFSRQRTKLKLTFSQIRVSVDTTLWLLGFTETTRTPGIKYYCKRNFQLNLAKHRAVFNLSALCFHMILHDKFLYLSIRIDVWNLLFSGSLNVFVTLPMMTRK